MCANMCVGVCANMCVGACECANTCVWERVRANMCVRACAQVREKGEGRGCSPKKALNWLIMVLF